MNRSSQIKRIKVALRAAEISGLDYYDMEAIAAKVVELLPMDVELKSLIKGGFYTVSSYYDKNVTQVVFVDEDGEMFLSWKSHGNETVGVEPVDDPTDFELGERVYLMPVSTGVEE